MYFPNLKPKSMKNLLMIAAFVFASVAVAQEAKTAKDISPAATAAVEKLDAKISLSKEQQGQVYNAAKLFERLSLHASTTMTGAEKTARLESLRNDYIEKMRGILNDEQFKVFQSTLMSK